MTTGHSHPSSPRRTFWRLTLAFVVFWAPVGIFLKLADDVVEQENIPFDAAGLHALHALSTPALDAVALAITTLGSPLTVPLVMVALLALLAYHRRTHDALILLFAVGGAALVNLILKLGFQRTRPALWTQIVTEHTYSFPSGHAMASSALAATLIALTWRTRWRWYVLVTGILYAGLVGLSRVYLGVHYPSDVIAGWCVSIIWVTLVWMVAHRIWPRTKLH